ncbi:hypothetical protein CRI93_14860 [Longimonas halophila]|uniref:Uncharacterized protein n=1 Tax=Longimonas halophila TaxID=1469170 RepID=A0A2H3NI43_9BACT|nr:hypothetical protein [Longimonas halophila]PEN04619.1 hypothetical protein CRI93_14860 [Longimonas halophila]
MNTMQADHETYTLGEMAERLDCSKSYVSRKARQGGEAKGFPVGEYAVTDGTGKLSHFNVPADAFEQSDDDAEARENTAAADNQDGVQSIRDVAREARERRENAQAERDREQLEADRQRRERAEQRRNARAKERDAQSDPDAHTYSVAEMAGILDATEANVRDAVADGRDVRAFPVSEFAVMNERGDLDGFRVPSDAFEDDTQPQDAESSHETGDPGDTQSDTAAKKRSGFGGFLALGAATVASVAMGAFDNE